MHGFWLVGLFCQKATKIGSLLSIFWPRLSFLRKHLSNQSSGSNNLFQTSIYDHHFSSTCYSMQHSGQAVSLPVRSGQFEPNFITLQGKPKHTGWSTTHGKTHPRLFPLIHRWFPDPTNLGQRLAAPGVAHIPTCDQQGKYTSKRAG